ncbi:MAG: Tol-Pal system beta propeller repeat protein TolB [Steroidobacteraceae bacterium]
MLRVVLVAAALSLGAAGSQTAYAQLRVEITSGVTDPIPIAIVPFTRAGTGDPGVDLADVIQHDLEGSGRFRGMARRDMLSQPGRAADIVVADWKLARNDYIVVGRIAPSGTSVSVQADLVNLLTGERLASPQVNSPPGALRDAAHRMSDLIYQKITGVRGAFATRIAYVSVDGRPPSQHYQLIVADADGENARPVTESAQPIMSPAFSPDGEWLAYVSFERRASAIFLQRLRTGERRLVSARAGINGAPAWSPDASQLAVTLSGSSGNLDIYVLDLATQALTRVTDDPAIDTEAVWADARTLYFTSDRGGGPQVYRVALGGANRPQRITFGSSYNARPRISADGSQLAFVTLDGSGYHVAVQDLASGTARVLSRGRLDESPSFAPNGAVLIYAGRDGPASVLATVSTDGLTSQRLKSDRGDVRDPVWGPFAQ